MRKTTETEKPKDATVETVEVVVAATETADKSEQISREAYRRWQEAGEPHDEESRVRFWLEAEAAVNGN